MSIYYINNSGLNVYPYSSPENGATNFNILNTNITFQDGDVIRFVASGGIIDDSGLAIGDPTTYVGAITTSLTFEKYDDSFDVTNSNPIWELGGAQIYLLKVNGEYTFDGIDIHLSGTEESYCFRLYYDIESFTVTNCKFLANNDNTTINNTIFQFGVGSSSGPNAKIENYTITNNTINNINTFAVIFEEINNVEIANNSYVNSPNGDERLGSFFYLVFPNSDKTDMSNWNIHDNYIQSIFQFIYLSAQGSTTSSSVQDIKIYNNDVRDTQVVIGLLSFGMDNVEIYGNVISKVHDTYINSYEDSIFFIVQSYAGITYNEINIHNNDISGYRNSIFMNDDGGYANIVKNITINDNKIHDINSIEDGVGIFQTSTNGNNINITNNFIDVSNRAGSDGITFIGNDQGDVSDINITNNILLADGDTILLLINTFGNILDNLNISYNNFINEFSSVANCVFLPIFTTTLITNSKFTNNIFYGENITEELNVYNWDANTSVIDNNNYLVDPTINFTNSITGALDTSGSNNIIDNPRWIDLDNQDFYLKQDSPCISAGTLDSDIGAVPYIDGVNVYVQDSVISNFNNTDNEVVVLRAENNAFTFDINTEFNILIDKDNQIDFNPPINYPLIKGNIGYNEDLVWLINNKSELAPFPDVDVPPNPGKDYPDFQDYPYGIYGFRRKDSK